MALITSHCYDSEIMGTDTLRLNSVSVETIISWLHCTNYLRTWSLYVRQFELFIFMVCNNRHGE